MKRYELKGLYLTHENEGRIEYTTVYTQDAIDAIDLINKICNFLKAIPESTIEFNHVSNLWCVTVEHEKIIITKADNIGDAIDKYYRVISEAKS